MKADHNSVFLEAWNRFGDHLDLPAIHDEALAILRIAERLDGGDRIRSRRVGVLTLLKEARARLVVYELSLHKGDETDFLHDPGDEPRESCPAVNGASISGLHDRASGHLLDTEGSSSPLDALVISDFERDAGIASPEIDSSIASLDVPSSGNKYAPFIAIDPEVQGQSRPMETSHPGNGGGFATESVTTESVPDEETPSPLPVDPWQPDRETYKMLIELMDLLDKARNDERMGPERMVRNLVRRKEALEAAFGIDTTESDNQDAAQDVARSLLEWISRAEESLYEEFLDGLQRLLERLCACLGLERIDRRGLFDVVDQHILEMVDTDDPALDQTIEGTVECGYRLGDWVLRPQKVFVYRFASSKQGSLA